LRTSCLTEDDHAHLRASPGSTMFISGCNRRPRERCALRAAAERFYYDLRTSAYGCVSGRTDLHPVNHALNRVLVARALELLDRGPANASPTFLRPRQLLAADRAPRRAGDRFEGSSESWRARGPMPPPIAGRAIRAEGISSRESRGLRRFDKLLIDPPRQGAIES